MLFSYKWLREFTPTSLSPEGLSARLTMAGIEVEGVCEAAAESTGVVIAAVLSVVKHPNADRLSLCEVEVPGRKFSVVCGASNVRAGIKVPLAAPGATLPGGVTIGKTKIRGVESEGMICSEVELGATEKSEGIMVLPDSTPIGVDINEALGLKDFLLDAAITPNRPDCMSIKGLAREISAITGFAFRDTDAGLKEGGVDVNERIKVVVEDGALCRRYAARVIEGVKVASSPAWLKRRLELHGVRSVNNVVDATNYVMLETGQPLHAFDLDKIREGRLVIRKARKGEAMVTIDGKERRLDDDMLVVCDGAGPQAIAGVMGGRDSEVTDSTERILLESAWFEPSSIRRTSRALGLKSDSSARFERGVDITAIPGALDGAAALMARLSGGTVLRGMADIYPVRHEPVEIEFGMSRAGAILGVKLDGAVVERIFNGLGIAVRGSGKDGSLLCVPPPRRSDIRVEADLIEEAARLMGYDTIPETMPYSRLGARTPGKPFEVKRRIREILVAEGFMEAINFSFVSRETFALFDPRGNNASSSGVAILNPLAEDQSVMRQSLMPSLLENLVRNLARKNEEVRLFECGPVFFGHQPGLPPKELPEERWKVGALMYGHRAAGWNQPKEWVDFYDMKGALDGLVSGLGIEAGASCCAPVEGRKGENRFFHPGHHAVVSIGGREAGVVGELHPDIQERFDFNNQVYLFEIDMEILLDKFVKYRRYSPLPKFPESSRDIAFIVDDNTPYAAIFGAIRGLDTKLIEMIELFDVYYGGNVPAGRRSMALRITYRSADSTLTYDEVEEIHSQVASMLTRTFNAEMR